MFAKRIYTTPTGEKKIGWVSLNLPEDPNNPGHRMVPKDSTEVLDYLVVALIGVANNLNAESQGNFKRHIRVRIKGTPKKLVYLETLLEHEMEGNKELVLWED